MPVTTPSVSRLKPAASARRVDAVQRLERGQRERTPHARLALEPAVLDQVDQARDPRETEQREPGAGEQHVRVGPGAAAREGGGTRRGQPQGGHEHAQESERRDQHDQARDPHAQQQAEEAERPDPGHERARRGQRGERRRLALRVQQREGEPVQQRAGGEQPDRRARELRERSTRPEPAARHAIR